MNGHALRLWLALAGLEVSWLCACAAFVCGALSLPVGSPVQAFAVYALAAGVGAQRGGSRAWRASSHTVGLSGALLSSLSALLRTAADGLWPLTWLVRVADRPLLAALVCSFTCVLWQRGASDVRRERSYERVCARFDRALFVMLALLLFQLLLRKQLTQMSALPALLAAPVLACGMCALALARNRHAGEKRFTGGVRGVGILFRLVGGALVAAAVGCVVLWPALQQASQAGYGGLYEATRPVARAYADVVLYVMRLGHSQSKSHVVQRLDGKPKGRLSIGSPDALHEPILGPVSGTWTVLAVALALLACLWLARRWLLARRSQQQRARWLAWLWGWLRVLLRALRAEPLRRSEPLRLYLGLLRWGRQSGAAKRDSETPQEYAARLSRLSGLQSEIDSVVSAFQSHAYGAQPSAASLHAARQALARLRAPRHWALRFKLWLMREPSG